MTAYGQARTCRHWMDNPPDGGPGRHCGATEDVHQFPNGWRCPAHTPAAIAGEPEPSGQYCAPGRCYCGREECPAYITYRKPGEASPYAADLAAENVIDARAIASGKRHASPARQQEARKTVAAQRDREARLRTGGVR